MGSLWWLQGAHCVCWILGNSMGGHGEWYCKQWNEVGNSMKGENEVNSSSGQTGQRCNHIIAVHRSRQSGKYGARQRRKHVMLERGACHICDWINCTRSLLPALSAIELALSEYHRHWQIPSKAVDKNGTYSLDAFLYMSSKASTTQHGHKFLSLVSLTWLLWVWVMLILF